MISILKKNFQFTPKHIIYLVSYILVAKCAKLKKMHVIKDHWKWIKCDKCQDYIDPLKMRMHLAFKHKIKQVLPN